jgi:hypothetical protein|tara:strand:- start:910 stop:1179 length:270 start_codon:yes stop_codon:yes gene_type:complete
MSSRDKLKAINDLTRSKGWQVISEIMKEEILSAALAIAETSKMDIDEINFRRGSIWAAKQLLEIPSRLQVRLESDIALSDVDDKMKTKD